MKGLIVNADDFGLAEGINAGIIKGYKEGFITSTSLMAGAPAFDDAVRLARVNPGLGIGIHLTLVGGIAPVLSRWEVPTLVDGQGLFPADYILLAKRLYTGCVSLAEIKRELSAQIERALDTGLRFDHIDSHQHMHVLPGLTGIVYDLCKRYGFNAVRVPAEDYTWKGGFDCGAGRMLGKCALTFCARWFQRGLASRGIAAPQHFFGMVAGGHLNEKLVANILMALPDGISEIMTHPGLGAEELGKRFRWGYHWEEELAAFTSQANNQLLNELKIERRTFGGLIDV